MTIFASSDGETLSQSIVTQNGIGETAIGIVVMRKGENSKQLVEKLELDEINKTLPNQCHYSYIL